MSSASEGYILLHDHAGAFIGVFIEAELWNLCKKDIQPLLSSARTDPRPTALHSDPPAEPLGDWESLLQYWDFTYPPAYDLACEHCGAQTDDWRADEPRKFRLTAANLGGLASFQCQNCLARITKRHFKKHVSVECRPFVTKS